MKMQTLFGHRKAAKSKFKLQLKIQTTLDPVFLWGKFKESQATLS
jgi:hypothetical protein